MKDHKIPTESSGLGAYGRVEAETFPNLRSSSRCLDFILNIDVTCWLRLSLPLELTLSLRVHLTVSYNETVGLCAWDGKCLQGQ